MNNNLKHLLEAVVKNDIQAARIHAKLIVDADKTQANKIFCNRIRNSLQASTMNLIELPHDIREILLMEDVAFSFNENRYFLSEREKLISEQVVEMYETSHKLSEMGIRYLNSLMLYGESGTGKTLFGRFIAYKLGLPFAYMNFSSAISSYLGSTSRNISKVFQFIEKNKCVLMMDEIDAVGTERGKNNDVTEVSRITISIMQALDSVRNDTVIIGATNRLDVIDTALLRRFSITHNVTKFSEQEMFSLISKYLNDIGITYSKNDIEQYCRRQTSQALAINDVIRAIANSIRTNSEFVLAS